MNKLLLTRTVVMLAWFAMAVNATAGVGTRSTAPSGRVQLPDSVAPEQYRLDLVPDADRLTFSASVEIDVIVRRPTPTITLNGADLVIDSARLNGTADALAITYDKQRQRVTLTAPRTLQPGKYTLVLSYHGRIFDNPSALFHLDYQTPAGNARALYTKFENSDARRFVPCWDEPGYKAAFVLTATVPQAQMAVSNMPVASVEPLAGNLQRVHFAATPKMSSYLLFFASGDFERVHRQVGEVDVGVIVRRGETAHAAYALETAATVLPYYNDYFGTPYPLPKLDLVAGPGASQRYSAMENWGAIFFFERALLVDPRLSSERDKQWIFSTVAHEMAHQWFGNLVTMAWWDDLWLNEGFASWIQAKVSDRFHPEWRVWLQALEYRQYAMGVDARAGTHPVITPIDDVLQADGAFDSITYTKGAAVIRMLEAYLGEDAFREGVRRYMHEHAYGNTVTDDLWTAMDQGSTRPIRAIASDFTLQAGVPMITARTAKCTSGHPQLEMSQGRFIAAAPGAGSGLWHIPVAFAVPGQAVEQRIIAGDKPVSVDIRKCAAIVVNAGQVGYFRTRYSGEALQRVIARYDSLASEDQLGILYDAVALAYVGQMPMSAMLDLTRHFPVGADPVVVSALVDELRDLDSIYDGLPTQAAYRSYARTVLAPVFAKVGWDKAPGESDNTARLRSDLISALGEFDDAAVLADVDKRFEHFVAEPSTLDASLREPVLYVVATHANPATWARLHELATSARSELERLEFYRLLGATRNAGMARNALALAISGEPPAPAVGGMIRSVARLHPALAFDFSVGHWQSIAPLLEPGVRARYVPALVSDATDLALIARLDAFARVHIPAGARQNLRKAKSNIRYLAKIRTTRLPAADRWLATAQR
ncbi:MAG: M1 family metallopeptidase [Casimicrobiaceae bacterium]